MKNFFRFLLFPLAALKAVANPTGLSVQSGSASAVTTGNTLNITASQNAFLNWQTFNIAAGEKTIFNQPSANSIVWNKINDANASQIYGSLQANGVVVLMNSAGFYFGPNSFVSAAGLVVSTANCLPPENNGGTWEFNGPPPLASIVNYGQLKMGNGGSAFLIADQVENHGDIEAPGGSIGPSEIAQALHHDWRTLLGAVRRQAAKLAEAGQIEILRKGKPVPPAEMRGVIRLRLVRPPAC